MAASITTVRNAQFMNDGTYLSTEGQGYDFYSIVSERPSGLVHEHDFVFTTDGADRWGVGIVLIDPQNRDKGGRGVTWRKTADAQA